MERDCFTFTFTCTGYNCLPEDEPLGSKHVHFEDIVGRKINLVLKKMYFFGLLCVFILQCTVQKT